MTREYHVPNECERAFLRLVCRGQPELETQIETCRISDYDPTGWCYVDVRDGPASPLRFHADGPTLHVDAPSLSFDTIVWVDEGGRLGSIEIIDYLLIRTFTAADPPYRLFLAAEEDGRLTKRELPAERW